MRATGLAAGVATVLVLAALLAGCFGMCGYRPDSAAWRDPGLFAAVQAEPPAGASLSSDDGPGFAFAARVGEAEVQQLRSLSWRVGDGPSFLLEPHRLGASAQHDESDETMRGLFRAFSHDVSLANQSALQAAEDAFVASRQEAGRIYEPGTFESGQSAPSIPFWVFEGDLPGPYRFEQLFAQVHGQADPAGQPDPNGEAGLLSARGGDYAWTFAIQTWTIPFANGTIVVDALDRVLLATTHFREGDDEADVRRHAQDSFAEAGLPPPTFEGLDHSGTIC